MPSALQLLPLERFNQNVKLLLLIKFYYTVPNQIQVSHFEINSSNVTYCLSHKLITKANRPKLKYKGYAVSNLCLFQATNVGARRACACKVAAHDSLPCKTSYNQSPNVCASLYRLSYDVSCN